MKLHLIKNNNLNRENFFNKKELQEILNLYGSMVSVGEWKDYGIYMSKTMISFEIYRKATENPLFQILNLLIIFILFIIFLIEIFAAEFLFLISPGFKDIDGKFDLAVDLSRITFPFLLFISISSFLSAILNSNGKFLITAAAPIILNILLILSLVLFHDSHIEIAYASSYALTLAGIIQVIFLFFFAKKYFKINLSFIINVNNQVKSFFGKLLPSVFASGVNQGL